MIFRSSLIQVFYSLFPVFLASFFLSSCIFLLLSLNSPSPLIPPSYPSSLLFRLHTFSYPLSHPPSLLLSLVSSFTPSSYSPSFSPSLSPSLFLLTPTFLPFYFISSLPFTPSHLPSLLPSSSLPLALFIHQVLPTIPLSPADLSQYTIVITTLERCAIDAKNPASSVLNKIRCVFDA